MSNEWLVTGTAHRTPVQRTPVIHLIVREVEQLWCSGGKGRIDNPFGNRLCSECKRLARDAAEEDMLDLEQFARWLK